MKNFTFALFVLIYILNTGYCQSNIVYSNFVNRQICRYAQIGDLSRMIALIKTQLVADPSFANNDEENNTALHAAARNGHGNVVHTLLLNGWDVNAKNDERITPLHYAAEQGYRSVVDLLIRKGADVNAKNKDGDTPLTTAIVKGNKKIVETLIYYGADVSVLDVEKSSKIVSDLLVQTVKERDEANHNLSENGKISKFVCFFQNIFQKSCVNKRIESELFELAYSGLKIEHVFWLLRAFKPSVNIGNDQGDSPLHIAAKSGHLEFVKALLMNGANVNIVNNKKAAPLHYAAQNGHEKMVELLLRKGASFKTAMAHTADTPLHSAAIGGNWACVYILLLHGADANSQNNVGFTPLHYAVQQIEKLDRKKGLTYSNYQKVIEALLQSSGNRHIRSHKGLSPMDLTQDQEIIEMFREIRNVLKSECTKYSEMISANKADPREKRSAFGVRATSFEFPWMASVGTTYFGEYPHLFCGGTIISEFFVLTASHCTEQDGQYVVRVGTEFIRREPTNGQDYAVEEIIRNNFQLKMKKQAFVSNTNDIALLRLEKRIKFSSVVSPACLNLDRDEEERNVKLIVSGWGLTENKTKPEQMLKSTLITMSRKECARWWFTTQIEESQYCAYDPAFQGNACQGDSGGPLQFFEAGSSMATVIGVVSYGSLDCPTKIPTVYTKVGYYLDWIQSHVWPNETMMKYFDDKNINNLDSGVSIAKMANLDKIIQKIVVEKTYGSNF